MKNKQVEEVEVKAKKEKQSKYAIGDEFTVEFPKNQSSKRPVGRINGMVCFIDREEHTLVEAGSTHIVAIASMHEKFLTVKTLTILRTPAENQEALVEKLQELKQKNTNPHTNHNKPKKGFQYKTLQELHR